MNISRHLLNYLYRSIFSLFNKVLFSGIIHQSWLDGYIKLIFKNKGTPDDPENYRPITILSRLGKLVTSVLNNRLSTF